MGSVTSKSPAPDMADVILQPQNYTIVDVRNRTETEGRSFFNNSIAIPLPELRERLNEIPTGKPIIVHCAGGYRSAAAASIIRGKITAVPVYDFGEAILEVVGLKSDS